MIINESGLARRIKKAYRSGGYTVVWVGIHLVIFTDFWLVSCPMEAVPRKALAAIVEHIGALPERDEGLKIMKDMDPQTVMPADITSIVRDWTSAHETEDVAATLLTYKGERIFQATGEEEYTCYGVSESDLELMEYDTYRHGRGVVADGCKISWSRDGVQVCIWARSTSKGFQDYRDKAVWDMMEQTDLKPAEWED